MLKNSCLIVSTKDVGTLIVFRTASTFVSERLPSFSTTKLTIILPEKLSATAGISSLLLINRNI